MQFDINLWGVLAAAVVNIIIGSVWYSPILFGKQWMALTGKTMGMGGEGKQKMMKATAYGLVLSLIIAYVLAHFIQLGGVMTLQGALQSAFWVWLGFVATSQAYHVVWEGRSKKLYLINTLNTLVSLLAMAATLFLLK